MIRIGISQAAFEAMVATLPFGSVSFDNKTNERGEKLIWLDTAVRLRPCAGRGRATAT